MRVVNKHTAGIDSIPSGAEGDVDETSGGIAHLLAQGLLVPVDGEFVEGVALMPSMEDIERMVQEIERRGARIEELEAGERRRSDQFDTFAAKAVERRDEMTALEAQVRERDSRIANLEAQVAAQLAELEKLTAPTAPEEKPVEAAPKKGK